MPSTRPRRTGSSRVPPGGRPRGAVSPVLCAATAAADRRWAFSFLPMLRCCPRLHTRFLPSGPRGRAWQIPSDAANQPRPGQLPGPGSRRAAPCRDSPPPGSTGPAFAQARQRRAGPSTSQTVLPLRPCAKNAARASRGGSEAPAGVTRARRPGSEPAGLAALVSQTPSLPQRVIGRHGPWDTRPPEVTSRRSHWLTLEPGSKTPRPQEAKMGGRESENWTVASLGGRSQSLGRSRRAGASCGRRPRGARLSPLRRREAAARPGIGRRILAGAVARRAERGVSRGWRVTGSGRRARGAAMTALNVLWGFVHFTVGSIYLLESPAIAAAATLVLSCPKATFTKSRLCSNLINVDPCNICLYGGSLGKHR